MFRVCLEIRNGQRTYKQGEGGNRKICWSEKKSYMAGAYRMFRKYNIPTEIVDKEPELGEGSLFFKDKYSISNTIVLTLILAFVLFVMIRLDVKHYLFRKKIAAPEGQM